VGVARVTALALEFLHGDCFSSSGGDVKERFSKHPANKLCHSFDYQRQQQQQL
jgi:hypothetical protein